MNNYAKHFRHRGWDININENLENKPITYTKTIIEEYIRDGFNIKFRDVVDNIHSYIEKEKRLSLLNIYQFEDDVKVIGLNSELLKLIFLFTPLITNMEGKEFGIFDNTQPHEIAGRKRKDYLWEKITEGFESIYEHTIFNMNNFINQFEYKNNEILIDFCKYLISKEFFEIIGDDYKKGYNNDYPFKKLFDMVETLL